MGLSLIACVKNDANRLTSTLPDIFYFQIGLSIAIRHLC